MDTKSTEPMHSQWELHKYYRITNTRLLRGFMVFPRLTHSKWRATSTASKITKIARHRLSYGRQTRPLSATSRPVRLYLINFLINGIQQLFNILTWVLVTSRLTQFCLSRTGSQAAIKLVSFNIADNQFYIGDGLSISFILDPKFLVTVKLCIASCLSWAILVSGWSYNLDRKRM